MILIDTQILLWSLYDSKKIPKTFKTILQSLHHPVTYSFVSLIEIGIKQPTGKLEYSDSPSATQTKAKLAGFEFQNYDAQYSDYVARLPLHHRDPFDRLLIAQAQAHDMQIMTTDPDFSLYDVRLAG